MFYIRDICCFVKSHPDQFPKLVTKTVRAQRSQYKNKLHQPPCKTLLYKKNVYNMCIIIYNNLPEYIMTLDDYKFKKTLTTWLTEKCFYSVKEYLENK